MVWWHFPAFQAASELVKGLGNDVITSGVKDAVKRTKENNPREDLGYVFSQLDLTTRENLRLYGINDVAEAYPRLHAMSDNYIGRTARNILDQRYETWYQHKPNENDFAVSLGNAIRRKPGEEKSIDIPETVKLFLYYADQEDTSFLRSMDRLKHDPFAQQIRYYAFQSYECIRRFMVWVGGKKEDVAKMEQAINDLSTTANEHRNSEQAQKRRERRKASTENFRKGGWRQWFRI